MTLVQPATLLSTARWTATQEKTVARDYPFTDIHLETPDQFVLRTYLQFLWLPQSLMPLDLLVPSMQRVRDTSPDAPHPLHALLHPVLLSVRAVSAKYHTDLPHVLASEGGGDGPEESIMWYALGYEPADATIEENSRRTWLDRLERREVQIQILLHLLKLSLPGPCPPLPRVKVPARDVMPSINTKRQKERAKYIVPSAHERLESFMDKLSTWQLVVNMGSNKSNKDERDWMQTFCEKIVEPRFKSALPDMCALLRRKLFPHSPFADEDSDRSSSGPQAVHPRPSRKLARSSTSTSISQSKDPKPIQRSSSVISNASVADVRSRPRSLSISLAQDASARRSNSTSGAVSSLKRALSREVSMSRAFKPRAHASQASQSQGTGVRPPPKPKRDARKDDKQGSQGVTLVAATPTKPKVREDARNHRSGPSLSRACSLGLDAGVRDEDGDSDAQGGTDDEGLMGVKDEDEELWLPSSSPDVLLLGGRKRSASGSSSSRGPSDPAEGGLDTPVKKRMRI